MNSDQGVDPNSLNQVAYVCGNPFMFVDPSGMWKDSRNSDEVGKTDHELCDKAKENMDAGRHSKELDRAIKDYNRTGKMSCNEGWDTKEFSERSAAAAEKRAAIQAAESGGKIKAHGTLQIGVTMSISTGPVTWTGQAGIAIDAQGTIGGYSTVGTGLGVGAKVSAGISVEGSNAATISDLSGPFNGASTGAFDGIGASIDSFGGPSANGPVVGGGFTAGVGLGGSASTGMSGTAVHEWSRYPY